MILEKTLVPLYASPKENPRGFSSGVFNLLPLVLFNPFADKVCNDICCNREQKFKKTFHCTLHLLSVAGMKCGNACILSYIVTIGKKIEREINFLLQLFFEIMVDNIPNTVYNKTMEGGQLINNKAQGAERSKAMGKKKKQKKKPIKWQPLAANALIDLIVGSILIILDRLID
jgi:hypothetical protein